MNIISNNRFLAFLVGLGFVFVLLLIKFDFIIDLSGTINTDQASKVGSYLAGTTGVLWGLAAIIFIYKSFWGTQVQQVENTFFAMMNVLQNIIQNSESSIHTEQLMHDYSDDKSTVKGVAFYSQVMDVFTTKVKTSMNEFNGKKNIDGKEVETTFHLTKNEKGELTEIYNLEYVMYCYHETYADYQAQLGHFFRYIYNIIKYVDENEIINQSEKLKLINLIQAQLSNDILGLIFYNGLTDAGKKFKTYLEKYPFLLENIDLQSIIQYEDKECYPNTHFKYLD